jgi:hypothetical protein
VAVLDVEAMEVIEVLRPTEVTDESGAVVNDVHGVGVREATGDEQVVSAAPARPVAAAGGFSCHVPV